MLRSGQPLMGPNKKRCQEDELLLKAALCGRARGFVIDTRSAQAAKQARMTGGGSEPKAAYLGWKRLHRPLERSVLDPVQHLALRLGENPPPTLCMWISGLGYGKEWH